MGDIKHIYVTGDSFSFGQELGPLTSLSDFYKFTDYMRQYSYTGIIADQWGVSGYTNNSRPSSANDRIHRTIMTQLPVLLETYHPSEIFVFISVTHAARREFYYKHREQWIDLLPSYSPEKTNPEYELWKQYTASFNHINERTDRYVSQILSIQYFLKSLGIEYLITDSMYMDEESRNGLSKLPNSVRNMIDRTHYPVMQSFAEYTNSTGHPIGPGGHPLETGHAAWAKYLMEYMQQHKIGKLC